MDRIPEPELMDDVEQALAYAKADFAEVNAAFVERFATLFPDFKGSVIDLGCGPADIPIRFKARFPESSVLGIDGSRAMLDLGEKALKEGSISGVTLRQVLLPEASLGTSSAAALISNSLLHHLHEPAVLWEEIGRLGAPGAAVLVRDLFRPESKEAARAIVDGADCSDNEILLTDFYNSLLAAFTAEEVREQLSAAGLGDCLKVEIVSDRHIDIHGRLPSDGG